MVYDDTYQSIDCNKMFNKPLMYSKLSYPQKEIQFIHVRQTNQFGNK